MMESVAARLLSWHRGLTGWHEARQRVYSHPDESQERGRAGPQARAGSTSQRGGLLASEASWTINRDKLKWIHVLLPALLAALRVLGDAPARSLTALAQRLGGSEADAATVVDSLEEDPVLVAPVPAAASASPLLPMTRRNGASSVPKTLLHRRTVIAA